MVKVCVDCRLIYRADDFRRYIGMCSPICTDMNTLFKLT